MQTTQLDSVALPKTSTQLSESDLLMAQGGSGGSLDDWRYEMRREIQEILVSYRLYESVRKQDLRLTTITRF